MKLHYALTETFDDRDGDTWVRYIEWSGLDHLEEVVSLDSMLCTSVIKYEEIQNPDSPVIYGPLPMSSKLDYVFQKFDEIATSQRVNLLALQRCTDEGPPTENVPAGFSFVGFDLNEDGGSISALLNCGGFDKAFRGEELSPSGLLTDLRRALQVQSDLRRHYPDEPHAFCEIWAIWRLEDRRPSTT